MSIVYIVELAAPLLRAQPIAHRASARTTNNPYTKLRRLVWPLSKVHIHDNWNTPLGFWPLTKTSSLYTRGEPSPTAAESHFAPALLVLFVVITAAELQRAWRSRGVK
jgi:hypothetical protein